MMQYHKTTDSAERFSHYPPAYPKMPSAAPAHVMRHDHQVATASRDDEEAVSDVANTMAQWKGNAPEKEAKALRHVFDDLQDHFGYQRVDPRVRFNNTDLKHLGGSSNMWFSDLDFTYDVNGDLCNIAFIGMDVCVDLAPKLVYKHGQPMLKNYGNTWVYCYLPKHTYDKFKSYVKAGTGWDVSDEGTVYDPNRNLVAVETTLSNKSGEPKPSFWAAKKDGDMAFSRIGTVQDVIAQPAQQRIHRGAGIFSISMRVEGSPNFKPSPRMDEADLCFTLVSLRAWGVTSGIAPIVHAPRKM